MKKLEIEKHKTSPRNCLPITKQAPEKRKSSQIKTTQSNSSNQPPSITNTPSILNSKDTKLSATNRHRMLKENPKLRNSISSKEDFRTKNNKAPPPMQINLPLKKQNKKNQIHLNSNPSLYPKSNPLVTGNSNYILTTNYSDKEEDKKPKSYNSKQEMSLNSLQHLGNLFRSSNFKQTIIIDDEGNNNLNMNLKHLSNRKTFIKNTFNFERNPLHIETTGTPKSAMPIKITYPTMNDNIPEQDQSQSQEHQLNRANTNPNDDNNNDGNDNNRLNEYKMIFKLLNSNIEQMKTIIEKNCEFSQGTSTHVQSQAQQGQRLTQVKYSHKEPQEISNRIISIKDADEINKVQCEPCDLSNNTIAIKGGVIANNNNQKNNSFLDSCLHEDFYQSFAQKNNNNNSNENKLNLTFEYSTILPRNDNNSINVLNANDQTECDNDDQAYEKIKKMHTNHISPHFLLNKVGSFKNRRSNNNKNKNDKNSLIDLKKEVINNDKDYDKGKDKDSNKCLIF